MTLLGVLQTSFWKPQRGIQTLEFALILPVLLLLVFGMIDFGRGYFSWLIITNGAREGARTAVVGKSASVITTKVQDSVSGLYVTSVQTGSCSGSAPGTLCISVNNPGGPSGSAVTVNVRYNFGFLIVPNFMTFTGLAPLGNGVLPLNAHATMRLE